MHAAIIGAINLELSKLIIGSTLTTEVSGTGSYNASETHASTKEARSGGVGTEPFRMHPGVAARQL